MYTNNIECWPFCPLCVISYEIFQAYEPPLLLQQLILLRIQHGCGKVNECVASVLAVNSQHRIRSQRLHVVMVWQPVEIKTRSHSIPGSVEWIGSRHAKQCSFFEICLFLCPEWRCFKERWYLGPCKDLSKCPYIYIHIKECYLKRVFACVCCLNV